MTKLFQILSASFIAFVFGAFVTNQNWFPYEPFLRNAFLAGNAVYDAVRAQAEPWTDVWYEPEPEQSVRTGVASYQKEKAAPELTLITVAQSAHLVDRRGAIRHTWHLPYETFRGSGAVDSSVPLSDTNIYWRPAKLLPGGKLLAIVDITDSAPQGLALIMLDSNSRLLWARHGHFHHDFHVARDGRIFALMQAVRDPSAISFNMAPGPVLDELVVELNAKGEIVRQVSTWKAFANSPYRNLMQRAVGPLRYNGDGDFLHANNVEAFEPESGVRFPFAEPGQLLLSLRNVGIIGVLDFAAEKMVWARRGEWVRQHDPDFLANGNLMLYDNQGDFERGGKTRIVEYNPVDSQFVWTYTGPAPNGLWSAWRGEQHVLSNRNVLINEFLQGRILEVTRGGEIVWEYHCPFRHPTRRNLRCRIMHTEPVAMADIDFAHNDGVVGDRAPYPQ